MTKYTAHDIARRMDASVLKFDTTRALVDEMVEACKQQDIGCAFAMPCYSEYLGKRLEGTNTEFGTSLGFPSGQVTTATKVAEAKHFVGLGADQVDMVLNVGWFKGGMREEAKQDILAVREATRSTSMKVIIETSLLTEDEILDASKLVMDCGANFVKSGTGFSNPTTLRHVELMKQAVGDGCRIKVAGGVRNLKTLLQMIELGAERFGIGLASCLAILEEARKFPDGVSLDMLEDDPHNTGGSAGY